MAVIKSLKKKKPMSISVSTIVMAFIAICFAMLATALFVLHSQTTAHSLTAPGVGETKARNDPAVSAGENHKNYHMVFSTSCSAFQDWQSIVFFYFAWKVKQPGTVTRIASGCKDHEEERLRQVHKEQIEILSPNFKLHVTPDLGFTGDKKYFNKPFGLRHWMEHVLGYPGGASKHDDDIVMILDPDMMLLRPLTHTFYNHPSRIWLGNDYLEHKMEVTHGRPMASTYGFGNAWLTSIKKNGGNMTYVVGEGSPVLKMSMKEAEQLYPAGPPYLATARDMYAIVQLWTVHVVKYYELFGGFMSEMYAYCTAAAHLGLAHQLAVGFMISDTGVRSKEGWAFLNNVSRADSCAPTIPQNELPVVFHYCQRYGLGRWFVGKYKLPEDFFTCAAPMLRVPPRDVGEKFDWYIYPNLQDMENFTKRDDPVGIIYNSYALCTMIDLMNEVATHYKKHHCQGDTGNYSKSYIFHTEEDFEKFLQHPELEVVTASHPGR